MLARMSTAYPYKSTNQDFISFAKNVIYCIHYDSLYLQRTKLTEVRKSQEQNPMPASGIAILTIESNMLEVF